ncbi:MAG: histidinol dehydrogenase [Candidatus Rokubacteria bacterium]|nr:histidinol dehydrogenase [Candidatus Rokubacteria bacterium]
MREYLKKARPRSRETDEAVARTVERILADVRSGGDAAVRRYSEQFDRWSPPSFRVSPETIREVTATLPERVRADIDFSRDQIASFARRQRDSLAEFEVEAPAGVVLGQRLIPVAAVAAYVPGGRYPLVASALMSIVTAKVAGVSRLVACSPPVADGRGIYPATLYAMTSAGADEIYCLGGVQALAAMAYGTETIRPVDMLVGPGNQYVAEAKRQLFGVVGIDLLAGPTEILVIADGTADPEVVAADLLGQSEHGPTSWAVLVTPSRALGEAVIAEVERLLPTLPTREVAAESWAANGEVIVVASDEEAVAVSDEYAPEHLEVQTRDPRWYLERLRNYGSLFLGEEATVAYSDKSVGTNHILPTGRAARYTGGLWVGKFLKTVTYQQLSRAASIRIAPVVARICQLEGMLAHGVTADLRLRKYRG